MVLKSAINFTQVLKLAFGYFIPISFQRLYSHSDYEKIFFLNINFLILKLPKKEKQTIPENI